ncbi:MAG: phenylalanine--tRNA ligase subunit beta, partial [Endomicrobium sp.]|nr:phenylalanine--tRNA ligase subunit beta [Endomicrobium sp.]
DIVISDDNKPIAIAGIIGGLHSSITKETRNIFLESAIFDAGLIRKTSRKLGLTTDSSYRFERGVGWDITELASWRSVNLITKIAGGTIEFRQDLKIIKYERKNVCLRLERISKILGYDIKKNNIIKILKFLGIDIQLKDEIILCSIPSWRNDIKIEVDLIEEIARINGYNNDGDASIAFSNYKNDNIETSVSSSSACNDSLFFPNIVENFRIKLNSLGFNEVLNYSFLEVDELKKFGLKYFYKIINPISKENEILRPSMLPSLYKNLLFNINYSYEKIALFEYGKIFDKYGERKVFAAIMYGKIWDEWWKWSEKMIIPKYDFYFGAGIVKNILLYYDEFEIDENSNHENYYHPGKTAGIFLKKKRVGQFGILNPTITSDDLNEDVFYFEINVDLFKNFFEKKLSYKTYSKFPVIRRDISVVVEKKIKFSEIENIIIKFMKLNSILIKYSLFSVYHDENKFGKNRISYSIRLFYQNDHKTLVDKEVNESMVLLLGKLREKYEIELRK